MEDQDSLFLLRESKIDNSVVPQQMMQHRSEYMDHQHMESLNNDSRIGDVDLTVISQADNQMDKSILGVRTSRQRLQGQ